MITRATLMLVLCVLGVFLALLLGGCAPKTVLRGSGEPAPPPPGWVKWCADHPGAAGCPT